MKLSQLISKPQPIKPEDFWLWHPVVSSSLDHIKEHGLLDPFLFGKRHSATTLRLPQDTRLILRVSRPRLDRDRLALDSSLTLAKESCQEGCFWDGPFRRWLNSLPLKSEDILTRWASGTTFASADDMWRTVKHLHQLEKRGMWRYYGFVTPDLVSIAEPSGLYVSIKSYNFKPGPVNELA